MHKGILTTALCLFAVSTAAIADSSVDLVKKLLEKVPEAHVMRLADSTVGDSVVVDGEINTFTGMQRVIAVEDGLRSSIVFHNLTTLSQLGKEDLVRNVESEIGSPNIHARLHGNHVFLEGMASSDFEADRAVEIAKSFIIAPAVFTPRTEDNNRKPSATSSPSSYNRNGLPITLVDMLKRGKAPKH